MTTGADNGHRTARYGDQQVTQGHGGETHQLAGDGGTPLTTQQGVVVGDDQNTLRAGERGPGLLEDFPFREKIFHFDHERIPERVVHARGYGAHGYFENYQPLTDITRADVFSEAGLRTPVFVRFSTVAGNKGSGDLARDVRGFATKFYTREGNWDLVGNNIPVFFIQDAIKFPDLIHAAKQEPDRGFPQAQTAHDNFWDFASLMPESTHMLLWIMSDRAIPRSFRFMEGFGVHTFRLVTADGAATYVKFHWKPRQGLQSVFWNEAVKINGADPDFHRRDLWDAITSGAFPEWELCLQLFDDEFADRFEFDILDPTKLIPEEVIPPQPVGRLVLDRVVDNFFAETEQVAFCTQNIVPGIDFTNDPLLQGRNFSYLDTQLKRLGSPNFTQLPVNAPKCPLAHFQQDGHMALTNPAGRANYEPNSWEGPAGGPREDPAAGFTSFPAHEAGPKRRLRAESFADHYSQARQFYLSQTDIEQRHIAEAFTFELSKCDTEAIRTRMVAGLRNVDAGLRDGRRGGARPARDACRPPARPPAADRPAGIPCAEHPRQRAGQLHRPQSRCPGHHRCRRGGADRAAVRRRSRGEHHRDRRADRGRHRAQRRDLAAGPATRRGILSALRRRRPRRGAGSRPQTGREPGRAGLRVGRLRALQVHRLHRRRRAAARGRRARGRRRRARRGLHQSVRPRGGRLHRPLPRTAVLGPPASPRHLTALRWFPLPAVAGRQVDASSSATRRSNFTCRRQFGSGMLR